MRVVVAYKWAPNPQEATVGPDGCVDWSRTRSHMSEYDAVAAEVARALVDGAGGGEVIGLSVGPAETASSAARKACLPKGFDRAVILADDALARLGTAATATCLAALVRRIGADGPVDLVLCGDGSSDVGAKLVPAYLAGLLGWPCLVEVTSVAGTPGAWTVERAYGAGTQRLALTEPAVLSIATDAATPRIVAVGRGVRRREDLALVDALAAALRAAVGCSRPLAEGLGWYPRDRYIGVSGRHVAPQLYLAVGISGEVQHLSGCRDAATLVSVNKDPDALIVDACDYAVVGDLYDVLPALTAELGGPS